MAVTLVTGGAGLHRLAYLRRACWGPGRTWWSWMTSPTHRHEAVRRIEELGGRALGGLRRGRCARPRRAGARVFAEHEVAAVIHFAAKKAVGESVAQPLAYYDNNLQGLLSVLQAMDAAGCRTHGVQLLGDGLWRPGARCRSDEDFPTTATNPYGWTKLMGEQILRDLAACGPALERGAAALLQPGGRAPERSASARIRTACPTTSCPSSARSRWAACRACACSATTTPRPTAPACATTSTWSTWRSGTCARSNGSASCPA